MIPRLALLEKILSQPTAPFRETHVKNLLINEMTAHRVPFFEDPVGNLIVGCKSKAEYKRILAQKSKEPLRIFIAHMDHPGFHGVTWKSTGLLEVKWFGGSPTADIGGARVWLANKEESLGHGVFREAKIDSSGRGKIISGLVEVSEPNFKNLKATQIFGGFGFRAPFWWENDLLYTKAADDLVGCFAILSMAIDFFAAKKSKTATPFIGLLSRAEEVGLVGTIGHFELGWHRKAKRQLLAVSLETSRQIAPGAEIGRGPVVRQGDRFTTFSPGQTFVFSQLASRVLPERHQKRVMDGGQCEGSAAMMYGLPTIAISVPLGNYHNQNFEGGPDSRAALGPAPEFVHRNDVAGLVTLCKAAIEPGSPWSNPYEAQLETLKKNYRASGKLLHEGL